MNRMYSTKAEVAKDWNDAGGKNMDPENYMKVGNKDRRLNEYGIYVDLLKDIGSELPGGSNELQKFSEQYNNSLSPDRLKAVEQGQEAIDFIRDSDQMTRAKAENEGLGRVGYVDKGYSPWAKNNYLKYKRKHKQ